MATTPYKIPVGDGCLPLDGYCRYSGSLDPTDRMGRRLPNNPWLRRGQCTASVYDQHPEATRTGLESDRCNGSNDLVES